METKLFTIQAWEGLGRELSGELHLDTAHRILFATDASVYREMPQAVVFPRSEKDIVACVKFASEYGVAITPRAGGTSLAGQAVGAGLVVDVSRFLREIVEINTEKGYAIIEPGVVRDQLNAALQPLGFWFGPNTSTANRCTLGGMFGNNSCGSTSITVGSTREHVLEARVVLADGNLQDVGAFQGPRPQGARGEIEEQGEATSLSSRIQTHLRQLLTDIDNRQKIQAAFPKREVTRRNTGYALDLLAEQSPFTEGGPAYNLCTLLAGSEGTLAFTTQLKVRILPLPPAGTAVAALHYTTIDEAMRETQRVMQYQPFMCELMDDTILRLARTNPVQAKNAAFVDGDPRALLLVEFRAETDEAAAKLAGKLIETKAPSAYATPIVSGAANVAKVWNLRAAGLGILGNIVGDAKAVACIEDTAVAIDDLADYIAEVDALMHLYNQNPVYYAHAGAGEIHLRPILNLKTTAGREDFFLITRDVAALVKKYRGSLSGEHGDGRVRAAFLPGMLGPEVYQMLVDLKNVFDPKGIFNPGKIVEAPPMNEGLRYEADVVVPDYETTLDFSSTGGLLSTAEKCNGSGDCRKLSGGAMCPSYRATLSEQHSTRGRANILREVLTRNQQDDPFAHPALNEAMDLCLSCKACTSECPSSVDMTNLKAEYQHRLGKTSLRTRLIAANETLYSLGGKVPSLANFALKTFGPMMKKLAGIASERSLPVFPKQSLRDWFENAKRSRILPSPLEKGGGRGLHLFGDEFTNHQDPHTGRAAIELLWKLGYEVIWPKHAPSGRAHLSKGLLGGAKVRAASNVATFAPLVTEKTPLVGLEPSAILGFRDEFPKLLRDEAKEQAENLAANTYTLDEFLHREFMAGKIGPEDFGPAAANIVLHVHCHEKALGDAAKCAAALSLPPNFNVTLLDSGCCGMAGSFGYEAEHYELSKTIAEQSLLRHLRNLPAETVVVANGTSCRHQVKDLMGLGTVSTGEALLRSFRGE
jgi:FAD/FMN-containing dehydrogenase/Fe-S oxidoreductase